MFVHRCKKGIAGHIGIAQCPKQIVDDYPKGVALSWYAVSLGDTRNPAVMLQPPLTLGKAVSAGSRKKNRRVRSHWRHFSKWDGLAVGEINLDTTYLIYVL